MSLYVDDTTDVDVNDVRGITVRNPKYDKESLVCIRQKHVLTQIDMTRNLPPLATIVRVGAHPFHPIQTRE